MFSIHDSATTPNDKSLTFKNVVIAFAALQFKFEPRSYFWKHSSVLRVVDFYRSQKVMSSMSARSFGSYSPTSSNPSTSERAMTSHSPSRGSDASSCHFTGDSGMRLRASPECRDSNNLGEDFSQNYNYRGMRLCSFGWTCLPHLPI